MSENKRKLVILDLALALIVLALFGLAPLTANSDHTDPDSILTGNGMGSGNDVGTSTIPRSRTPLLYSVSMEATSASTTLQQ